MATAQMGVALKQRGASTFDGLRGALGSFSEVERIDRSLGVGR